MEGLQGRDVVSGTTAGGVSIVPGPTPHQFDGPNDTAAILADDVENADIFRGTGESRVEHDHIDGRDFVRRGHGFPILQQVGEEARPGLGRGCLSGMGEDGRLKVYPLV